MTKQHDIKGVLSAPESITFIRDLIAQGVHPHCKALAQATCKHFGFYDPLGRPQETTCADALQALERAGHYKLPRVAKPRVTHSPHKARRLSQPVAAPENVPSSAEKIRSLRITRVDTDEQKLIWNELMLTEHYLRQALLVGSQICYLIDSDHGVLGGFGFSASAIHLADRDEWIGWDDTTRSKYLNHVVCMSRFLIRTMVKCNNLASHALSLVLRCVSKDYLERYGYEPWVVESFVDKERFTGTSYIAANFLHVGSTKGRGRFDRKRDTKKSIKDIYLYILKPGFRDLMEMPPLPSITACPPGVGIDTDEWAEYEFANAPFGNLRRVKRLIQIATTMATKPGVPYNKIAHNDNAALGGYFRFVERPEDDVVSFNTILEPHYARTLERAAHYDTVLLIQDGSDVNFGHMTHSEGRGQALANQTGVNVQGVHLHSTMVITTEGLQLGLLSAQCMAPISRKDDPGSPNDIPIEQRKSFNWIQAFLAAKNAADKLPNTRLVIVADREAHFYELFDEQRQHNTIDLLVRAKSDRLADDGTPLFDKLRCSKKRCDLKFDVPLQSQRAKKSGQQAYEEHPGREALMELRYEPIQLKAPQENNGKKPIQVWAVHVIETKPPGEQKPLEWLLLSTCEVASDDQALKIINWYTKRWRIEDWHRVLKSGYNIEQLNHKTVTRLKRPLAVNMVIALRAMRLVQLGRTVPGLDARAIFTDLEIEVLEAAH